jgi:prepilin-type N-terminal cleavage/methylation domain-containing protein
MPTLSVGKRSSAAGVTLVEMLVVVTIIGLVTAVMAPSMMAGLDGVRMASASDNVASFLNSAVNRVERRQQVMEVIVSMKDNKLVMMTNEPGFTRELKMPEGIVIEAVLPRNDNENVEFRRVILMPGGAVPGIGIQLVNQHNNRRIVRLDPMTGFPRVENVKADQ